MPIYTPREKYNAFSTSIYKENLIHFAGNSYLQILPGEAELILVGEYVSDDEPVGIARDPVSDDITLAIGNDPVLDDFRIAEVDAYRGTYLALVFYGDFASGNRQAVYDTTRRKYSFGVENYPSLKTTIRAISEDQIDYDMYMSGVNDSPGPEVRNSPMLPTDPVSPFDTGGIGLTRLIGGVRVASQSFLQGVGSFKRKPRIGVSAELNPFTHGQLKDLVKGPINTKTYDITSPHGSIISEAPVNVKFYVTGNITTGIQTTSQNINPSAEVHTPYIDGHSVSREVDELIITT